MTYVISTEDYITTQILSFTEQQSLDNSTAWINPAAWHKLHKQQSWLVGSFGLTAISAQISWEL